MQFIQRFETQYSIPLEQIYTAKMMFGLEHMIQTGIISPEQKLLVIHTGGLQGRLNP